MKKFEISDFIDAQEVYNKATDRMILLFKRQCKEELEKNNYNDNDIDDFFTEFTKDIEDLPFIDFLYDDLMLMKDRYERTK